MLIRINGRLPDGTEDSVIVRVASIAPFLMMKSMALDRRDKAKDAWDIYFCLLNYPQGLDALAEESRPHMNHGLFREGLGALAARFRSATDFGPTRVANFAGLTDSDDRAILRQDACQPTRYLLERLGLA
jgi:predicted nucleotidyltransferase